eukprot:3522449-Alexandrium_andersonii.AAC.1
MARVSACCRVCSPSGQCFALKGGARVSRRALIAHSLAQDHRRCSLLAAEASWRQRPPARHPRPRRLR